MAVSLLPAEKLFTRCEPGRLDFETTEELQDLEEVIGQDRALEAIRFGAAIAQEGCNLFVVGALAASTTSFARMLPALSRRI